MATYKPYGPDLISHDPIRGIGTWSEEKATGTRQIRLDDITAGLAARSSAPFLDCLGASEREAKVDIVFVHGLSGGSTSTWKSGNTFWPQDLCRDFPEAQILLLTYDPHIWGGSDCQAVRKTADDLLRLLSKARLGAGASRRPLIWIAHSVGGCLVKAAYVRSKPETIRDITEDELFPDDIYRSTAGMIFFGTPHKTRSIGGWRSILRKIRSVAGEYRDDVGTLELSTHDEENIFKALSPFELTLNKVNLPIVSFYEKHESFHDGVPVLVTGPDNALFCRHETILVLEGNHVTMSRFQGCDSTSYRMTKEAIERFVAQQSLPDNLKTEKTRNSVRDNTGLLALDGLPEFPLSRMEEDIQNLFRFKLRNASSKADDDDTATRPAGSVIETFAPTGTLNCHLISPPVEMLTAEVKFRRLERLFVAQSHRDKELNDVIYEEQTPQWIPKTPNFERWRQSGYLLVVRGPIGSGKSGAACAIVRHLDNEMRSQEIGILPQAVVLYHFASKIEEPRSAVLQMLHQFFLQLLEIFPHLGRHFPTDWIFLGRQKWPSGNRQSSHPLAEECDRSYSSDDRFVPHDGHQDLVWPLFSSEELCEILVSALRDEAIGEATLVVDGLDESPGYKHNELENILDIIKNVPGTKVCITTASPCTIYDDQENLDITSAAGFRQHIDAFSSEQFNVIRQHLFPPDGGPRCSKASFHSLKKIFSSQDHGSYLHMILIQQVLNRLPDKGQIDDFIGAVTSAFVGSPPDYDKERIYMIMHWILRFLEEDFGLENTSAAWMLIIVSLSVDPLTVNELRSFLAYFMAVAPRGPGKVPLPLPEEFVSIPTHPGTAVNQLDLHEIADKNLFGLLTVHDGLVTAIHPFVNTSAIKYHAGMLSALNAHMAVHCINLLGQFSLSGNVIRYDSNSPQHSTPMGPYRYPLRYWFAHLRRAGKSCRSLWPLLQQRWVQVQLRQVLPKFTGCALPPTTELPLSCLLAALNLDELLSELLADSKSSKKEDPSNLSLEMRCAAANLAQSSLKVLIEHGHDPGGKDEAGLGIMKYQDWARIHMQGRRIHISKFPPGHTPLSEGVRLKPALEEILRSRDNELNEALIASVRRCEVSIAAGLLELGASSNAIDNNDPRRQSALHIAASMGSFELVQLLLRYDAWNLAEDRDGIKPIHLAAQHGHHVIAQLLASMFYDEDARGRSPLFTASESSSLSTLRVMLKFNININLRDKKMRTPLHSAASAGSADVVRFLLTKGAAVDAQDIAGVTPLHIAAWGGWRNVVAELLYTGASVNLRDHEEQTALHWACKSPNPSVEVVQVLLESLSNPDLVDTKGRTALHIAARSGSFAIVDLLLGVTSTFNRRDPLGKAKNSPLDLAIRNNSKEVLRLLERSEFNGDRISWSCGSRSREEGIDLDVVFVHLFRSTGHISWVMPTLGEVLGEDLKSSRFIEWDYDSGVSEFPSVETFNRLAVSLLSDLSTFQNQVKVEEAMAQGNDLQPPIFFVGHDLAGLVIKAAVKIASENASWMDLSSRIKGCVFLGTPHQGTTDQSMLEIVSQLADRFWETPSVWKDSMSSKIPYKKMIQALRRSREESAFSSLQKDFVTLCSQMRVLYMHGTLPTSGKMLVPPDSAFQPTPIGIGVDTDHIGISDLLSRDSITYTELVDILKLVVSETQSEKGHHEELENAPAPLPTDDKTLRIPTAYESRILRSLRSSSKDFDELIPRTHDEVLSSQLPSKDPSRASPVSSWAQNPSETVLWISGTMGCGKSVFMRQLFHDEVIDGMLRQSFNVHESNLVKAAFTFQHRGFRPTTAEMLRSLLYQILVAKHELISRISHEWSYDLDDILNHRRADIAWLKSRLEGIFAQIFSASPETNFCLFIDALDESAGDSAGDLAHIINRVRRDTKNAKICFSSKPQNVVHGLFSRATTLYLHRVNSEDIREFVSSRTEDLPLGKRGPLHITVAKGSSGSFLWARLVTDKIAAAVGKGDSGEMVLRQIKEFPRELQDTYEGILDRVSDEDFEEGWKIFRLVLLSNGRINAVILSYALELPSGIEGVADPQIVEEAEGAQDIQHRISLRINHNCGGLLEVSELGDVQFVHKTVGEFVSTNPRYCQNLSEKCDFHPHLVLMGGHIRYMTKDLDHSSPELTERIVSDALKNAKLADSEMNDTVTYVHWFETLGKISLEPSKLRQLRSFMPRPLVQDGDDPSTHPSVESLPASSIPELYQYYTFLALKLGLVRYLEHRPSDPFGEERRRLVDESLSLAFNFENTDMTIPWAGALPSLHDLPDPEAVRILLAKYGQITTENTAYDYLNANTWPKVLATGYYCFGVKPFLRLGPNPTLENRKRWIKIVEYFLRAGAKTDVEYNVLFGNRSDISSSSQEAVGDVDERVISPERAIVENLDPSGNFGSSHDELLSLLKGPPGSEAAKGQSRRRRSLLSRIWRWGHRRERSGADIRAIHELDGASCERLQAGLDAWQAYSVIMSFGFANREFIAAGELAWKLYRDCYTIARGAPQEFQLLLGEISTLSNSLKILQEEVSDPGSTLVQAGEDRIRMVNEMVSCVNVTLKELQKVAKKYEILGTGSKGKQIWVKLKCSSLKRIESSTKALETDVADIKNYIRASSRNLSSQSSGPPLVSVVDDEVFKISLSNTLMKNAEVLQPWSAIGADQWIQAGRWWLLKSQMELYAAPVSDHAVPLPAYANLIKASWILVDIIACHPQLSFLNSSTHYEVQLLSAELKKEFKRINDSGLLVPDFYELEHQNLQIWETQARGPLLRPGKKLRKSDLTQTYDYFWTVEGERTYFQK
ncbi:hypothetical protein GP486_004507 [Trichoglossum hirsutum]|uniref:Nephrocystin 3-like N-terminal domain-containing protein n=1 Tax=Trichoglossum hirsutum TaxID=265104 RepID=A0A9P8LAY3_9PEZI|nr:hypothetical protein GP486_004507 [Trichoglossum hirsutum]